MNGLNVVSFAAGELGYAENPPNSNNTKFGIFYGLPNVPWCGIFVSYCYSMAGIPLGHIDTDKGFHYCPSALNHFKATKEITDKPQVGDIVLFDWENDNKPDHAGIFLQDNYDGVSFMSIEGNTAIGNDSNGGRVMIRNRRYKIAIFVHPKVLDI